MAAAWIGVVIKQLGRSLFPMRETEKTSLRPPRHLDLGPHEQDVIGEAPPELEVSFTAYEKKVALLPVSH
jgi:hypothetical protein